MKNRKKKDLGSLAAKKVGNNDAIELALLFFA